ncbi:hypothetical protein [Pseudobacteroides cellulosolvens]|uniref:hypothetical protein n=1 Tax=Pseudobacteroides cellulosolvens TaxID=35825 RepID=UPI003B845A04
MSNHSTNNRSNSREYCCADCCTPACCHHSCPFFTKLLYKLNFIDFTFCITNN